MTKPWNVSRLEEIYRKEENWLEERDKVTSQNQSVPLQKLSINRLVLWAPKVGKEERHSIQGLSVYDTYYAVTKIIVRGNLYSCQLLKTSK